MVGESNPCIESARVRLPAYVEATEKKGEDHGVILWR